MRRLIFFFGLLTQAMACESAYVPPCALGSKVDRIFVGTVIEARNTLDSLFSIEEPLKGIEPGTKQILVGPGPCSIPYRFGGRYLVLVSSEHPGTEAGFTYGEPAAGAALSIDFFRTLARGEHLTTLSGRIAANTEDERVAFMLDAEHQHGLPGVKITASKDGHDYTASTDSQGAWAMRVPEPGQYQLTATLTGYSSAERSYGVEVAPDSCQELNLGMWTASRVVGHLTSADGQPAIGITVQLSNVSGQHMDPPHAKTDQNGAFEFTRVPTGQYLLGVNLAGRNSRLPYSPRFYPGVSDEAQVTLVKIDGAKTIEGLDFQLGPPLATRKIEIDVQWSDGKPVINASVTCTGKSPDDIIRYVDRSGHATCEVLADEDFTVEADRLSWKSSDRPIQPIVTRPRYTVPAATNTVHLTFVVDRINDISATEAPENMSSFNDQEE